MRFEDINSHKREGVRRRTRKCLVGALERSRLAPASYLSLRKALAAPGVSLIAEVKCQSRSKQAYRVETGLDAGGLARIYADNGAAAVAVLADELFFGGSRKVVEEVSAAAAGLVPVIYKEFIVDPYQVAEAFALGADAVLIVAWPPVDVVALRESAAYAHEFGMECGVETLTADSAAQALASGVRIIGINHRDLTTSAIHFERSARIRATLPASILTISETGLRSAEDVRRAGMLGFDAVLTGEALLTPAHGGR